MNFTDLEGMASGDFVRLSRIILKSSYYKYSIGPQDKLIFERMIGYIGYGNNNEYYRKGLLIANVKINRISDSTGYSGRTIERSLKRLDKLGFLIKIRKRHRNNRYIMGFRTSNNDSLLLIYHLVIKYEDKIRSDILKFGKNSLHTESYVLDESIKNFIIENSEKYDIFRKNTTKDKKILKYLFDRNDYKQLDGPYIKIMDKKIINTRHNVA